MSVQQWRRSLRRTIIDQFLRLMKTEEVRRHINLITPSYGSIREQVEHQDDPYRNKPDEIQSEASYPPVFLTGRFRSGSTLLWNIFRSVPGCTAYYEPFNERRWFRQEGRGDQVDATHQGVSDYWSEYAGLEDLGRYYREDWIRYELYMDEKTFDPDMKRYITRLATVSRDQAVLQFNRVDFRLPWIKANYPDSPIIHIYRNPRDQWCSTLRDPMSYPPNSSTAEGFIDRFYLQTWVRDLCQQFPFLERYRNSHQYYNFYLLWRLSYSFGLQYADISVSMEKLTKEPSEQTRRIFDTLGWSIDSSALDLSFVKPAASRWQEYATDDWFAAIEDECNQLLKDFLR